MSNMKCPFCNQKLEPIGTSGQFQCGTWGCDASFNFIATRDVWEYIDRTRKALDVALCSLQNIAESDGDFITGASTPLDEHEYADMMLKEIKRQMKIETALEQKEIK